MNGLPLLPGNTFRDPTVSSKRKLLGCSLKEYFFK